MSNLSCMWMIDSLDLAAISVSVSVLLPEQSIALVRNANQGSRSLDVCHENRWCGDTGQAHDKRRKPSPCLISLHESNSLNHVLPGPGTPLRMQPVRPGIDSRAPCWQVFVVTRRLNCHSVICFWSLTGVSGFLMRILSSSTKPENAMAKYM